MCERPTLHARPECNHILHALISLFLCGLWIPVWLIAQHMAYHEPYKCQTCGTALSKLEMHQEDSTVVFALKLFFFCVAVILLAILVFAIFPPSGWFK